MSPSPQNEGSDKVAGVTARRKNLKRLDRGKERSVSAQPQAHIPGEVVDEDGAPHRSHRFDAVRDIDEGRGFSRHGTLHGGREVIEEASRATICGPELLTNR